jgi:hypothetical protein
MRTIVWPMGRVCLARGYGSSIVMTGREQGKRARFALYPHHRQASPLSG